MIYIKEISEDNQFSSLLVFGAFLSVTGLFFFVSIMATVWFWSFWWHKCNSVWLSVSIQLPVAWGERRAAGPGSQTRGPGEETAAPSSGHRQGSCHRTWLHNYWLHNAATGYLMLLSEDWNSWQINGAHTLPFPFSYEDICKPDIDLPCHKSIKPSHMRLLCELYCERGNLQMKIDQTPRK